MMPDNTLPMENRSRIDRQSERLAALESNYAAILLKLDDMKTVLNKREHYDTRFIELEDKVEGNGKPGFSAIRDKVMAWESKVNLVLGAVLIDIVIRVVTTALNK